MTDNNVALIMKSHKVDEETARQILADIKSGKREVASNDELRKKAGIGHSDLRKSTRSISALFGDSLMSLEQPARGSVNRDNGSKPRCGNAAAKGLG